MRGEGVPETKKKLKFQLSKKISTLCGNCKNNICISSTGCEGVAASTVITENEFDSMSSRAHGWAKNINRQTETFGPCDVEMSRGDAVLR